MEMTIRKTFHGVSVVKKEVSINTEALKDLTAQSGRDESGNRKYFLLSIGQQSTERDMPAWRVDWSGKAGNSHGTVFIDLDDGPGNDFAGETDCRGFKSGYDQSKTTEQFMVEHIDQGWMVV